MYKRTGLIFFLALTMLLSFGASALIVRLSDLQTMVRRSDIVIHGYVGNKKVTTDKRGRLVTLTEIEVVDGLYGAKTGEVITVYQVGGEKDGVVMPILGGHDYRFGQELILFGLKLGRAYVSYGAGLGKIDIVKNDYAADGAIEDLGNVVAINPGKEPSVYRPQPLDFPDLEILKDELRLMVEMTNHMRTRP